MQLNKIHYIYGFKEKQQCTKKDIERKKKEAKARRKMCETSLCENINKKGDKVKYNFPHFTDICLNTLNVKPCENSCGQKGIGDVNLNGNNFQRLKDNRRN